MENMKQHEQAILEWLRDESRTMYCVVTRYSKYVLVKLPMKGEYGIIYVCDNDKEEFLRPYKDLEYQGFYRKGTAEIYNAQYKLRQLISEEVYEERRGENLRVGFETEVRERVEALIGEIEKDIRLDESTSEIQQKRKSYAESQARQVYLKSGSAKFKYHCKYDARYFEEIMLDYVMDKEKCVTRIANEYFENRHEIIISDIVENLMAKEIYDEMEKGEDERLTAMRNIIASIEPTYRTVNVTINVEGKELTFKYEADTLRKDCGTSYNTWDIPAKDRREFDRLYGRSADFTPENITKITYGRKTIYEKGRAE